MVILVGWFSVERLAALLERFWPSTVRVNDVIDFSHDADGLVERNNDLLVLVDVVVRKDATFSVLKPLVAHLVCAYAETPHIFGDTSEADGLCLVDPDGVIGPRDLFDLGAPATYELGDGPIELD